MLDTAKYNTNNREEECCLFLKLTTLTPKEKLVLILGPNGKKLPTIASKVKIVPTLTS